MPWLLIRYVLVELLRIFAIAASVLVMVTAFGAAIKPIAAEDLVGPLQTLKYIMLAIVPMLQFALPFAAGFAGTLVFHRLTTDNEVQAAAAGGISYRRLLLPVAAVGGMLLVAMVLLTQSVIPRFWALMDRHLAADVARVILASIEKGMPFEAGRIQIYADRGWIDPKPADTDAQARIVLIGVVGGELDQAGRIVTEVTARQAVVDVYHHRGRTYLKPAMVDTVVFDSRSGQLAYSPEMEPKAIPVPAALQDDPMFMTQGELLELYRDPGRYGPVAEARDLLGNALQQTGVWREIDLRLQATGRVSLRRDDLALRVEADRLDGETFVRSDGRPVEIVRVPPEGPAYRVLARTASLQPSSDYGTSMPTADLVLRDCEVVELGAQPTVNRTEMELVPGLRVEGLTVPDPSGMPLEELLAAAAATEHSSVQGRIGLLTYRMRELRLEIRARLLQRYAMSLTALLLPVLGAALAMWLRDSLPLYVYVWAFAPSILDVLLISGGDHMIRDGQVAGGVVVMWSGNAILMGTLAHALIRLMRN
jgi:lipopolysaccharide export LptBFGC system permease protein LptF